MSTFLEKVYLIDVSTNNSCDADLITDLDLDRIEGVQSAWRSEFKRLWEDATDRKVPKELLPEHDNWDWDWKAKWASTPANNAKLYAIEYEEVIEGLLIISHGRVAKLPSQEGHSLLYIDYVSAAPWSLEHLCEYPRFRGIGTTFWNLSIALSENHGYHGRVSLHSLKQSENFYRKIQGMDSRLKELGPDPEEENLQYFEREL